MNSATTTDPIQMAPCPFCSGPPSLHWKFSALVEGAVIAVTEKWALQERDDDVVAQMDAYIFCHECGAVGPSARDPRNNFEPFIYTVEDIENAKRWAANTWNTRNARHIDLYVGGYTQGLQEHPRPSEAESVARIDREIVDLQRTRAVLVKP